MAKYNVAIEKQNKSRFLDYNVYVRTQDFGYLGLYGQSNWSYKNICGLASTKLGAKLCARRRIKKHERYLKRQQKQKPVNIYYSVRT